jgi:hypothetical protein
MVALQTQALRFSFVGVAGLAALILKCGRYKLKLCASRASKLGFVVLLRQSSLRLGDY